MKYFTFDNRNYLLYLHRRINRKKVYFFSNFLLYKNIYKISIFEDNILLS